MEGDWEKSAVACLATVHPQINADVWRVFAQTPVCDLSAYHFSLGLYLRNHVLTPEGELYQMLVQAGITHKDDMSAQVLRVWYETLNK